MFMPDETAFGYTLLEKSGLRLHWMAGRHNKDGKGENDK
jgi:hypothetical protein